MRVLMSALLVLYSLSLPLAAQTGAVKGKVVTQEGLPIVKARVSVDSTFSIIQKPVTYAETDERGNFVLGRLQWGTYYVFARKDEDGYPDTTFAFYSNNDVPKVTLSAASPVAEVTIKFGPKAGRLVGIMTDASTHTPVNASITFTMRRLSNPNYFMSTGISSRYEIMVPAGTDVLAEVHAAGYKTWKSSSALRLQSEEKRELNIALEPAMTERSDK